MDHSRAKKKKKAADRISLLSDDLLHLILSFLHTQAVIKTSVLSKRWRNLWTSMPTLIFDYGSYSCDPSRHRPSFSNESAKEGCFRHFILRVLSRRNPLANLQKLTCSFLSNHLDCYTAEDIDMWDWILVRDKDFCSELLFNFVASHHVDELCINGRYMEFETWCCCLSTCRSLKLTGHLDGTWVPLTLKFMKSLEIENHHSTKMYMDLEADMFPECPLLERLVLRGPCFERAKITAPKLEYLEMGFTHYKYYDMFPEIVLSTPKLACVKLYNLVPSLISTDDFLSLHKVEFSILNFDLLISQAEMPQQVVGERLSGLLNLLQHANTLAINLIAVEVLSQSIPSPMEDEAFMFHKLRHLRFKGNKSSITMPNHMLSCLLHSSSLETFAIEELP